MKAFIYTGGKINIEGITVTPSKKDLKLAADSGYENAVSLGVTPDILLGDFDSISSIPEGDFEKLEVPAEKDFTDTQLAVSTAIAKGADEIIIIGGLSGRLDHTLSNLSILEDLWEKKIHAHITDGYNRADYIESSSTLVPKSHFKYISIIALSDVLKGVDIEGCKYPLKKAKIKRNFQFAVSNEIVENCAFIAVRKGKMLIISSIEQ